LLTEYNRMKKLLIAVFYLLFISCNSPQMKKKVRGDEPVIYEVSSDDKEMNAAIDKARRTLDTFRHALKADNIFLNSFSAKLLFTSVNREVEYIWLSNVTIDRDKMKGVVDNTPDKITSVKFGDTIYINGQDISDWFYMKGDTLVGGYTLRLLRNRMSKDERKEFDAKNGVIYK
jgi:uncharacterized protein YegJ (DUF2314 family)